MSEGLVQSSGKIVISLTAIEVEMAVLVGGRRNVHCLFGHSKPTFGLEKDQPSWNYHVEGAAGEMAFCKWLNEFWIGGFCTFKGADHSTNIQVRTNRREDGCLNVRPKDNDSHYYVLLTGIAPTYIIRGWILGKNAKKKQWLTRYGKKYDPCYAVPQSELNPFKSKPNAPASKI